MEATAGYRGICTWKTCAGFLQLLCWVCRLAASVVFPRSDRYSHMDYTSDWKGIVLNKAIVIERGCKVDG